jgi:hemerythrin-like metal-binding domain
MSLLQRLFHRQPAPSTPDGELIHWDESLSVGNNLIDNEHREILRLLNLLYTDWRTGAYHLSMALMLTSVDRTLRMHFANEEAILARHRYPDLTAHHAAHAALLDELDAIALSFQRGGGHDPDGLLTRFVRKVVVDHVLVWDMEAHDHLRE